MDGGHGDVVGPDVHLAVVDVIEGVDQPQVVAHVFERGGSELVRVGVEDVRRRSQRGEVHAIGAEFHLHLGIRPVEREALRRPRDGRTDQALGNAHRAGLLVHSRPRVPEGVARPLEVHA